MGKQALGVSLGSAEGHLTSSGHDIHRTLADMVRPEHTALLIHDMQNDFCTPGGKVFDHAAKHPEAIRTTVARVVELLHAARSSGVVIVYLQNMHLPQAADVPPSHLHHLMKSRLVNQREDVPCIRGTWGHQIIEELRPQPQDIIIEKGAFNDFHNSMLDKVLRVQGVETVVLTGISSHAGILATAFGLIDHGYYFLIPRECVGGNDPELHAAAMALLKPHAVAVAEILQEWSSRGRS